MQASDHTQYPIDVDPYSLRPDRPPDDTLIELAEILNHYQDRLIVFLGAGASVGAKGGEEALEWFPTAIQLRNEIWRRFVLAPSSVDFDSNQLGMMSLDQATAIAEARVGRRVITEFLARRFQTTATLWQHAVLPFLRPKAVYTTNYDRLIELGWDLQFKSKTVQSLLPVFADKQPWSASQIPLFKPHGSAERALSPVGAGGPVITTIDYFEMLSSKRELLRQWLKQAEGSCVLLIGYSMSDMDIAGDLYRMRQEQADVPWYAVFPRNDKTVRNYWVEKLRIRPIARRFAEFMVDLDQEYHRANGAFLIPENWQYKSIRDHQERKEIQ